MAALRRVVVGITSRQGLQGGEPLVLLDQIWVSEEFVATSRFAIGDVKRVEVFNDHLHESRERWRSDHGFVRAMLRMRMRSG